MVTYLKAVLFAAVAAAYTFLLPALFSARSTELVLTGLALLVTLPLVLAKLASALFRPLLRKARGRSPESPADKAPESLSS